MQLLLLCISEVMFWLPQRFLAFLSLINVSSGGIAALKAVTITA